jgi:hypothetical protein
VRAWYAAGDCERVWPGLIGQPANAVSAAAYLLAGGWLLVRVCRPPGVPRRYRWLAVAVAANGVGSGLYHGPGWPGSRWCHDVAAIAVPVLVAADGLGGIRGWNDRAITRVGLGAVAVAAAAVGTGPATNPTLLTALGAAVLAEAVVAARATAPAAEVPDSPVWVRKRAAGAGASCWPLSLSGCPPTCSAAPADRCAGPTACSNRTHCGTC